jgi:restriction system protein
MNHKDFSSATVWGIHAGKTSDADPIFLRKNQIALSWELIGDLSVIPANRDSFKRKLIDAYPGRKEGYYPVAAGQLFRFLHEIKVGDLVVYPSKSDRQIHIGEIIGGYEFIKHNADTYPNRRAVRWLQHLPRTRFSQGALFETGSAMSFFLVKSYADEFIGALGGQQPIVVGEADDTVSYVAEDIEQNTRDFVLKVLAQELKGHGFAEFIGHLLGGMGYRTRIAPPGPDGGIDIIAHKDELGFEPPIIKVQVKSTEGSVGDPIVSQLIGKLASEEYGLLITLGSFTSQAINTARNKSNLRLIDGNELVSLVLDHYEQFDSRYKGMLPLKRVYVPEPMEEE